MKLYSRQSLALLLLLTLAVGLLVAEWLRRGSLYWHDVTDSYSYVFSDGDHLVVDLDEEGFRFTSSSQATVTAILEIDIESTMAGGWFEPYIEFSAYDRPPQRQYFERGARGIRYLNLGQLIPTKLGDVTHVSFVGQHLHWRSQSARLSLLPLPGIDAGPILVVAPHPDDAEIAAFGLYSASDAWVVTVTAGNSVDERMAHLMADPVARSDMKGKLRAWDSYAVPMMGNVPHTRILNLGYFQLSLEAMYKSPNQTIKDAASGSEDISKFRHTGHTSLFDNSSSQSNWSSLVKDLKRIIGVVQPKTIVAPHPILDRMMEHKLTTVALLEALEGMIKQDRTFLLYTNHAPSSEYFPYGPADSMVSVPAWSKFPLVTDSVYSLPISEEQRVLKLYALDAQHDLRDAPRYVDSNALAHFISEFGRRNLALLRDPTDTYSYMRRAPRPNEFFFVMSEDNMDELVESFLLEFAPRLESRDRP